MRDSCGVLLFRWRQLNGRQLPYSSKPSTVVEGWSDLAMDLPQGQVWGKGSTAQRGGLGSVWWPSWPRFIAKHNDYTCDNSMQVGVVAVYISGFGAEE